MSELLGCIVHIWSGWHALCPMRSSIPPDVPPAKLTMFIYIIFPSGDCDIRVGIVGPFYPRTKANESGVRGICYYISDIPVALGVDAIVQLSAVVGVHVLHVHFCNFNALLSQVFNQFLRGLFNLLLIRFQLFQRQIQRFRIQFEFDGRHSALPPQTTSVRPRTRKPLPV